MVTAVNSLTFRTVVRSLSQLLIEAPEVHVGEWQAITGEIPQADTIEVEDISFAIPVPSEIETWQGSIAPDLPWAEDHFLERVSGIPHNPPPSEKYWPYRRLDNKEFKDEDEKFSHTYPERFWPKWVGDGDDLNSPINQGLRYPLGDLLDVVNLLRTRPGTRQAYLPVWFPEDTGAVDNQRVPCTLGYHFMIRDGHLKCVYYIRSCDFFRHFKNDVYMAGRLCQWVAEQVGVIPDRLVMHISSLHIFAPERPILEMRLNNG